MKNKTFITLATCLLLLAGLHVQAQKKDAAAGVKTAAAPPDTLKFVATVLFADTTGRKPLKAVSVNKKNPLITGHIVNDTIYLQTATLPALDTTRLQVVYRGTDSLYNITVPAILVRDTSGNKNYRATIVIDTAVKAKKYSSAARVLETKKLAVIYDSLHKLQAQLKYVTDTTYLQKRKLYLMADSSYKNLNKSFPLYKLDSLQRKAYSLKLRADSSRIKKYLDIREQQQKLLFKTVTAAGSGYRSKKLLFTLPCLESDTLFIKNSYRKVRITTSVKSALSITTVCYYKDSISLNDEALLKKMGITAGRKGSHVKVTVDGNSPQQLDNDDPLKPVLTNPANSSEYVAIEVPANITVVINTSNTETNLVSYIKELKTQVVNGSLTVNSAGNATFKADYCTITAGSIQNAEVYMFSSKLTAVKIGEAIITSGASVIKLDECKSLTLKKSSGDEISLDKAGSVKGNKNFGRLSVTGLQDTVALSGYGTAIDIKKFTAKAAKVEINSKYADVKLPLSGLNDYAVYYKGSFNDVNKTAATARKPAGTGKERASFTVMKDSLDRNITSQYSFKTILKAKSGNLSAGHTKIDIDCPYCNVVFN